MRKKVIIEEPVPTKRRRSPNGQPKQKWRGPKDQPEVHDEVREAAIAIAENVESQKLGRPSRYHESFCRYTEKLIIVGGGVAEIADALGCSHNAIYEWTKAHPNFAEAIKRGRENADRRIEQALDVRARGYERKSQMITKKGEVVEVTTHYPPDPTSIIFWLKNRQPDRWRDRREVSTETPNETAAMLRRQQAAMMGMTSPEKEKEPNGVE